MFWGLGTTSSSLCLARFQASDQQRASLAGGNDDHDRLDGALLGSCGGLPICFRCWTLRAVFGPANEVMDEVFVVQGGGNTYRR